MASRPQKHHRVLRFAWNGGSATLSAQFGGRIAPQSVHLLALPALSASQDSCAQAGSGIVSTGSGGGKQPVVVCRLPSDKVAEPPFHNAPTRPQRHGSCLSRSHDGLSLICSSGFSTGSWMPTAV